MDLLFKFEKSPVEYLKMHQHKLVAANSNLEDKNEFRKQSGILKLAANNTNGTIETSMIIKSNIEIGATESHLNKYKSSSSYWLVNSTFNSNFLVKNEEAFKSFLPVVGMAVQLKKDGQKFKLEKSNLRTGKAFCFLPLSIETNLNYHINGAFALSDDRQSLWQKTSCDKDFSNKYMWNEKLIMPLIDNLISLFESSNRIFQEESTDNLVEFLWPLNNKHPFFEQFEQRFYETIFKSSNTKKVFSSLFSKKLLNYNKCLFVDFDFDSKEINDLALQVLNEISSKTPGDLELVKLPKMFMERVGDKLGQHVVKSFDLLEMLIRAKDSINLESYSKLIIFFLNELSFEKYSTLLTNCGGLILVNACIPTCDSKFQLANNLIDPNAHSLYLSLFEKSDGKFPSDLLCADKKCLIILKQLGMLDKDLSVGIIVEIAKKIEKLKYKKAKLLSSKLIDYLKEFFILHSEEIVLVKQIKIKLGSIKWLFAKEKPKNWNFPWYPDCDPYKNQKYTPAELASDEHETIIGCVQPVFDSQTISLFVDPSILINQENLVEKSIEQLKMLINNYHEIDKIQLNTILSNLKKFFESFYEFLQDYSTENSTIQHRPIELYRRIDNLQQLLPFKWIFCPENHKHLFLDSSCVAINVEYEAEPVLCKLSKSFSYKDRFFTIMGVADRFDLDFLARKLLDLQRSNNLKPLDKESFHICKNIVQEMIHLDQHASNIQ
jgi:sacsin